MNLNPVKCRHLQSNWDSVKRYKLNKMINKLGNITGHGTELDCLYSSKTNL
jgi:hypothetical protein